MAVSREPEFGTVRMREAYDLDDVDDFVDLVIDSLEGKGTRRVSPEQIERYEFKVVRMRTGYAMEDVDRWLDGAAAELRQRQKAARQAEPARTAQPAPAPPPPTPAPPVAAAATPVTPAFDDSATQWWPAPAAPAAAPLPTPAPMSVPAGFTTTTTYGSPAYDPPVYEPPAFRTSPPAVEPSHARDTGTGRPAALVHHIELWVRDFDSAVAAWGWLFQRLGWRIGRVWEHGCAWTSPDGPYIVIESGPDLRWMPHDRRSPGMNHLALEVPDRATVDRIVADGPTHGWQLMFPDRHPFAGGPDHYAAYMENGEGFEVEIVSAE